MSIYATWLSIDDDNHENACDRWVPITKAEADASRSWMLTNDDHYFWYDGARPCTCGELPPLVYQGSHINPSEDDQRGGFVMLCAIPNHCHPDARAGVDDAGAPVDFLRLSVREDPATYHGGEPGNATVVLTKKHVAELRDTLTAWLEAEERS